MSQANPLLTLPVAQASSELPAAAPAPPPTLQASDDEEPLEEELTYQSLPFKLSEPMSAKVEYIGQMPPMPYPLEDENDE